MFMRGFEQQGAEKTASPGKLPYVIEIHIKL